MTALLVMKYKQDNIRVLVTPRDTGLVHRVTSLLNDNQSREAFELLRTRAEVKSFLPEGAKLSYLPDVSLIEDLL